MYESLDIPEGVVASSADVGRGEEREDIFNGFRELPELSWSAAILRDQGNASSHQSNSGLLQVFSLARII